MGLESCVLELEEEGLGGSETDRDQCSLLELGMILIHLSDLSVPQLQFYL